VRFTLTFLKDAAILSAASNDRGSCLISLFVFSQKGRKQGLFLSSARETAHVSLMSKRKRRGSIYTPRDHAQLLVQWAIRRKTDRVIDLGVGEGVFSLLAFNRLLSLGATRSAAGRQIYGSEIEKKAFDSFTRAAHREDTAFPNVVHGDFLSLAVPPADAVLGNPPYVRRSAIARFKNIQRANADDLDTLGVSRLSDLYIYFLVKAALNLKLNGRMAVITADTWLNVRYGRAFKELLEDEFAIDSLVSFDNPIFCAEVKPVLLFATKVRHRSPQRQVWFVSAHNGLRPATLTNVVGRRSDSLADVTIRKVASNQLRPADTWTKYFDCADLLKKIVDHRLITTFESHFTPQIGVQTLANDFFVLSASQVAEHQIERQYLAPFAHSSQPFKKPIIARNAKPTHFLFYCSATKKGLHGTKALKYIRAGEKKEVTVRGKGTKVVGYQNKKRITKDRRPRWYDLRTGLDTRPPALILIPRVFSRTFQICRNDARFIPGEPFIECRLNLANKPDLDLCLAVLTNSLVELFIRADSQLYGGGAYTVSPRRLRQISIVDFSALKEDQKEVLRAAYRKYIACDSHDRSIIDSALYDVLDLDSATRADIAQSLSSLVRLSAATKKKIEKPLA
jgi:hypothetical protein